MQLIIIEHFFQQTLCLLLEILLPPTFLLLLAVVAVVTAVAVVLVEFTLLHLNYLELEVLLAQSVQAVLVERVIQQVELAASIHNLPL
jgi:membrane protein implicated in regulation of membrane protease activity